MMKWWKQAILLHGSTYFWVSWSLFLFPEGFWKAEMSLFEETASGQTKKQANALTRKLISSGLFQSQTKSPFVKHWTDIVQHNKLVKVKFKLCLLSWPNIKALLCWTIFPLPNVCLPAIDSVVTVGMRWWTRHGCCYWVWWGSRCNLSDELNRLEYSVGMSKSRGITHTGGLTCKGINAHQAAPKMFIMTPVASYNFAFKLVNFGI